MAIHRLHWTLLAVVLLAMLASSRFASQALGYDSQLVVSLDQQAASSRYRKIALNGLPLGDAKPQATPESDSIAEQTYVDAFDLSLHHSTTDIHIPVPGSDLALEVRRSSTPELWYEHYGVRPAEMPDRPFGSGWTSNLAASIHFVRHVQHAAPYVISLDYEADCAYVTDLDGEVHRFVMLEFGYGPGLDAAPGGSRPVRRSASSTYDGDHYFVPLPSGRNDQESYLCTLSFSGGQYTFTKKYGQTLYFQPTNISYTFRADRAFKSGPLDEVHSWARLTQAKDRTQTTLIYTYDRANTVVPSFIQAVGRNLALSIQQDENGLVRSISDPMGHTYTYDYDACLTPSVDFYGNPGYAPQANAAPQTSAITRKSKPKKKIPSAAQIIVPLPGNLITGPLLTAEELVPVKEQRQAWRALMASGANDDAQAVRRSTKAAHTRAVGVQTVEVLGAPEPYFTLRTVTGPAVTAGQPVTAYSYYAPTNSALVSAYTAAYECQLSGIQNPMGAQWDFNFAPDYSHLKYVANYGYLVEPGHPSYVQTAQGPDNLTGATFTNLAAVGPLPNADQTALTYQGHHATLVHDAAGGARMYQFTGGSIYMLSSFKPFWPNQASFAPLKVPHIVYYQGLTVTSFSGGDISWTDGLASGDITSFSFSTQGDTGTYGSEFYHFNLLAGMALDSATDLSGNTTTWTFNDNWNFINNYPFLYGGANYAFGFFADPTSQTDALGHTKTFSYNAYTPYASANSRRLRQTTDEIGRTAVYTFDGLGNRTSETITDPRSGTQQSTSFTYVGGLMTSRTVHRGSGDPAWAADITTTYTPDALWRVASETTVAADGQSLTTAYTYDANGNKTSVTDPRGYTTSFTYDARNQLTQVTYPETEANPGVNCKTYVYDLAGRKIQETDENGAVTNYYHDALGRVVQSCRQLGGTGDDQVRDFAYDGVNSKIYESDTGGHGTWYEHDHLQRLTRVWDARSQSIQYRYDGPNSGGSLFDSSGFHPIHVVDKRGFTTTFAYDSLYRAISQTVSYGGGSAQTLTAYDEVGRSISVTDPLGHVTSTAYDVADRPLQTTFADQTSTLNSYTGTGLKWKVRNELGFETETAFDGAGRPVTVTGPAVDDGNGGQTRPVTQSIYDLNGNVTATIDPLQRRWDFTYDERNRKTVARGPAVTNGSSSARPKTKMAYDRVGNLIAKTDPLGNVTDLRYDAANRLVETEQPAVALPDGSGATARPLAHTTYDASGNAREVTDANGHVTINTFDELNRLIHTQVNDAFCDVGYEYDENGNRTAVTDAEGRRTEFTYDGLNRNTGIRDAFDHWTTFAYDAFNKTGRTDANGQQTDYDQYDARNRLTHVAYNGRSQDNRTYAFDAAGHLLSVDQAGSDVTDVAYGYDALGRVITETSAGVTSSYQYDLAGNKVRSSSPFGGTDAAVSFAFDAMNRVTSMTESGSRTTSFAYDLNGNVTQKQLPNGDSARSTYDALNRPLVKRTVSGTVGGGNDCKFAYAYDLVGNVVSIEESYVNETLRNRTIVSAYDAVNRLWSETIQTAVTDPQPGVDTVINSYNYDGSGNRTNKQVETIPASGDPSTYVIYYNYNTLNQLTDYVGAPDAPVVWFTYDNNGNRITRNVDGVASPDLYSYDFDNRLVSLTQANGTVNAYDYDYRTRRVRRQEGSSAARVAFSGGVSVLERPGSGNGAPSARFVRGGPELGGGVGGLLYSLRGGSSPSFAHYNSRGDVVMRTDGAGVVTYLSAYDAFGTHGQQWGATEERQQANTKEEDPTGLLNEGMRYRDLEAGVFITRDPAGFVDGPNLYCYVRQNPWSKFDPTGLWSWAGFGMGVLDIVTEPFREIHDVALSVGVGINNAVSDQQIYSEDVRFASMLARSQQARIDEGQAPTTVAIKGIAEIGANIGTGGGYSVGRGIYENVDAYNNGKISLDELDYNLSHIAGGQTGGAVLGKAAELGAGGKSASQVRIETDVQVNTEYQNYGGEFIDDFHVGRGLLSDAIEARNAHAAEVGAKKATVTAGFDPQTGRIAVGASGKPHGCAENEVYQQLGDGTKFTPAIRPRTGLQKSICPECENRYGRISFPAQNTLYETDGN